VKKLDDIKNVLQKFEAIYGISASEAMQGTGPWFQLKLGVPSASNASKIVAKKGSATRDGYMAELVAQIATGIMPELNGLPALEWGKDHEDAARSSYEFLTGYQTIEVPFVFKDDSFRAGMSPDFLVEGVSKSGEIKCPFNSKNYVEFLVSDKVKPEWQWQCQYQMWVLGSDSIDFCQYDPRMKKNSLKLFEVERDEKMQTKLDEQVPEFLEDMDKMLEKAGFKFGDQWERLNKTVEAS
jgi:hypothetical protein